MKNIKQAFTLVELIVVVTILAILATIGFVSYSGYLTGVRDTNRVASLTAISDGLELYRTKNDLPLPDSSVEVQVGGETIARQGYAGSNVLQTIEYSKAGKDPKDDQYYSYYLTDDKKHYQMMAFLEESDNLESRLNYSAQPHPNPLLRGEGIAQIEKNKAKKSNILLPSPLRRGVGGEVIFVELTHAATDYSNRHPKVYGKRLGILTDLDNTPIQEITSIKTNGNLNMTGGFSQYKAFFEDNLVLEIYPENGKVLQDVINTKGLQNSCTDILQKNKSLKGGTKSFFLFDNNEIQEIDCDMDNGGKKRYYRLFDGVDNYVSVPNITATGDFQLELEFIEEDNNYATLIGFTDTRFTIGTNNNIVFQKTGSPTIGSPVGSSIHNKHHKMIFSRVGNLLSMKLDGVDVASQTTNTFGTLIANNIGRDTSGIGGVDYFKGNILNVNFKSGWTYPGGTNPYYELGDNDGLLIPKNNILGEEKVTNGTFDSNLDGWTQQASGYWTWENGQAKGANLSHYTHNMAQSNIFTAGEIYKISYESYSDDGSNNVVLQKNDGSKAFPNQSGYTSGYLKIINTTGLYFKRYLATQKAVLDNISAKKCGGCGEYFNFDTQNILENL